MTPSLPLHRHFHRLAWLAVALTLCVVLFGGFVRLSNAGLSCPDWPTCYGRISWPVHDGEVAAANAAFPQRVVETHKAWREQVHRMLAGGLGVLVLGLALLAARHRPRGRWLIAACSGVVALSLPAYIGGQATFSALLAGSAVAVMVGAALRWGNEDLSRVATLTLCVIVFQALLGMWTVTWLLKPVVVMGHLLGGLTTFALLSWMAWASTPQCLLYSADAPSLRRWTALGLVLLSIQIALGGWTSSNYAAFACGTDFPKCLGVWWPTTDFAEAFVLWRGIGVDYEGGVLDAAARAAIQISHRLFAVLVTLQLCGLAWRLTRSPGLGGWAMAVVLALLAQIGLGIANVSLGLPLWVAVAHLGGGVLLLFLLVALLARLRAPAGVR